MKQDLSRTIESTADKPLIASGLSAGYGSKTIVSSADIAFEKNTLTVLLGPNGSGKSTLLSTLARLLRPSEGTVLLHGRSIHELPTREVASELGILPQAPVLPENMTAFDLVSFGRHPHLGMLRRWTDADSSAVKDAMQLTGTLEFSDRSIDSLSGGQRQRCWIAMALAQETGVILLDEPTTFLDLKYQVEVMELLHSLVHSHNRTIIAVLHDLNLALSYADRLVMMKEGQIRANLFDPGSCTPELVQDVFDLQVISVPNPANNGRPIFMPWRVSPSQ